MQPGWNYSQEVWHAQEEQNTMFCLIIRESLELSTTILSGNWVDAHWNSQNSVETL